MTSRVLVTGGSGYLGSFVRQYFSADDFSRRGGGDVCDPSQLALVADYDVVIHMAAAIDKSEAALGRCMETNVVGTANVLSHLQPGQIIVFLSTKEVYGNASDSMEMVDEKCPADATDSYPWSKLIGEQCVLHYAAHAGVRAAVFRLSSTYAPLSQGNKGSFVNFFVDAIRSGRELTLRDRGLQVRDFLYVDDLSRAIELFLHSDVSGETFNIGGGLSNSATLVGLTEILGELTGRRPTLRLDDEPAGGQSRYVTDSGKAEQAFGWQPTISLRDGLKRVSE